MLSAQTAVIHTLGNTDRNGTTLGSYAVYTDCNGTHPG